MNISDEAMEINGEHVRNHTLDAVVDAVNSFWKKTKSPIRTKTIAFLLSKPMGVVSMPITRALKENKIKRVKFGYYIPYKETLRRTK